MDALQLFMNPLVVIKEKIMWILWAVAAICAALVIVLTKAGLKDHFIG